MDSNTLVAMVLASPFVAGLVTYAARFLFERNVKAGDDAATQQRERNHELANGLVNLRLEVNHQIGEFKVQHEKLYGRVKVLEVEITHDKEFRDRLAPLPQEVAGIRAALEHLIKSMDEAFGRLNTLTDHPPARRRAAQTPAE